jgi:tRNA pseudouridine55 synthase
MFYYFGACFYPKTGTHFWETDNMGRRRNKGKPISGWLVLDKPTNMTSTHAVSMIKRLFGAAKAGHAGTLDPLATGCLPIALGEATKTVPYVMDSRKIYSFTVQWGAETNTDDSEGEVVHTHDMRPSRKAIEAVLPSYTGNISQVPPSFSAIKINGERAYDMARDGEEVIIEPRDVTVYRLELVDMPDDHTAVFEAECGKGTYVRSLARDIGRDIGCLGHITALRRELVGPFDADTFVTLPELQALFEANDTEGLMQCLEPVDIALQDLGQVTVSPHDAGRLARGLDILIRGRSTPADGEEVFATTQGRLVALGTMEAGRLVPRRVFQIVENPV